MSEILKDRSFPVRQLRNQLTDARIKPKELSVHKSKVWDMRSKHY